jgi:hypothetical protein
LLKGIAAKNKIEVAEILGGLKWVDATLSNQLIHKMLTLKNRSVWLMWPKPSQGKVPADPTLASAF